MREVGSGAGGGPGLLPNCGPRHRVRTELVPVGGKDSLFRASLRPTPLARWSHNNY